MKTIIALTLITFTLIVNVSVAQEIKPVSTIKATGRYSNEKGIELRFFPDQKNVLYIGLKNGFIIERKLESQNDFIVIDTVNAFKEEQWNNAIENTNDAESKSNLELAKDFYLDIDVPKGGDINFDEGIAKLKEQKGKEDFEFMVFVLTAIKDKNVAEGLGLSYEDKQVQEGKTYVYRIKVNGSSQVYTVESEPYRIEAKTNPAKYENKVYTKIGDTRLSFIWEETADLSGYYVERAKPGETNFVQLNDAPIYTLTGKGYEGPRRSGYSDENLINYQTYTYRFYGNTAFGERVQFAEVKSMPRDLTPPQQPFLKQPKHIKPDEVLVTWEMSVPVEPDLKGFAVSRSESNEGEFQILHDQLLSKETRNFTDKSFSKEKTNYYLVQAIDTANNVSSSFPVAVTLIDTVPPKKPEFISGKIDSSGVVTLEIELNKEKDLMGYRLFKANDEEHEFSLIQEGFNDVDSMAKPIQLIFKDTVTLNSLTPYIYYRIRALDYNFNQSAFSEILKVKRPDTIAPTTPVITRVIVRENEVELHFALSESEDVTEHVLYRKTSMDAPWDSLAKLELQQNTYIDKNVTQGITYYYSIRAKDNSNLYSDYARAVFGKPYDNGVRPSVEKITISQEEKKVVLSWEYENFKDGTFFVIYKMDKKGNLKQYDRSEKLSFTDLSVMSGLQSYAIVAATKDGGQSDISKVVALDVK